MCGIFGVISPQQQLDINLCCLQTNTLLHRGPDGLGILIASTKTGQVEHFINPDEYSLHHRENMDCDVFLGHRRLSILDLSSSAMQPMSNEDGHIWIVFNGEIYNYEELRRKLIDLGHRFHTDHSDTEVLIHGYEEWGTNLTQYLRGMFAFAIVNFRERTIFLARDRFGEKPLYYLAERGKFIFASELKAIIRDPNIKRVISPTSLYDYLRFGYVPSPDTIYTGINKLKAAEQVVIKFDKLDDVRPEVYWNLEYNRETNISNKDWISEFDQEIDSVVKLRMLSDVPLGAFLSGGLDSTMVVRSMSKTNPGINTFSAGFTVKSFDETAYAKRVAEKYSTNHFMETISSDDLLNTIPIISKHFDEPFADSSAIPTYLVSKMARKNVTVALSGDGGDELLAGYFHYIIFSKLALLDQLPKFLVKRIIEPLSIMWPESVKGKGLVKLFVSGTKDRYKKHWGDNSLVNLLSNKFDTIKCYDSFDAAWNNNSLNIVDKMCYTDMRFFIPEDCMTKVDRASMAVSLETRAPLLDHKLFELVANMPLRLIFNGNSGKLPFKEILAKDFGNDFINRRKKGFAVPLGNWFRNELNQDLHEILLEKEGLILQLFPYHSISKLIDKHVSGSRDQSYKLWRLYMLAMWHKEYGGNL